MFARSPSVHAYEYACVRYTLPVPDTCTRLNQTSSMQCACVYMHRCADAQMRRYTDAQMRRCADVQMHIMYIYIKIQPLYHDNHVESALHETPCDVDVVASIIVTIKSDIKNVAFIMVTLVTLGGQTCFKCSC